MIGEPLKTDFTVDSRRLPLMAMIEQRPSKRCSEPQALSKTGEQCKVQSFAAAIERIVFNADVFLSVLGHSRMKLRKGPIEPSWSFFELSNRGTSQVNLLRCCYASLLHSATSGMLCARLNRILGRAGVACHKVALHERYTHFRRVSYRTVPISRMRYS